MKKKYIKPEIMPIAYDGDIMGDGASAINMEGHTTTTTTVVAGKSAGDFWEDEDD